MACGAARAGVHEPLASAQHAAGENGNPYASQQKQSPDDAQKRRSASLWGGNGWRFSQRLRVRLSAKVDVKLLAGCKFGFGVGGSGGIVTFGQRHADGIVPFGEILKALMFLAHAGGGGLGDGAGAVAKANGAVGDGRFIVLAN